MASSGGSLLQPASGIDAGTGRDSLVAMKVIASLYPGRSSLRSVSWNDGGLDVAVAVEHVPQHVMQARKWRFAGDVIGAADLLFGDQRKRAAHRFGGVMERSLQ